MNKKLTYEQPSCDLFVIKVEENFLASEFEVKQLQEGNSSWWNDEE